MRHSYLTQRLRSFVYAFQGLAVLAQTQHNARIHAVATLTVVAAGIMFRISSIEWCLIGLSVVCVWVTEALNTAIELLVDLVSPDLHPLAAKAKDVAAGAVLIAAVGALVIGALVFGPKIWDLMPHG